MNIIKQNLIINKDEEILITGSNGFIGTKIVETLLSNGFYRLKCFVRKNSDISILKNIINAKGNNHVKILRGNLLSKEDCDRSIRNVSVVYHLAAGMEKTFAGAYMNSVISTRNLLESTIENKEFKRFVNISSLAVYTNFENKKNSIIDENSKIDKQIEERYEPYSYGKIKQDEIILDYHNKYNIPYVIVRPSVVYGPGKYFIPSRVGIDTFGIFLHLGGNIKVPLTYIDNCAEAIFLAGIYKNIDGEIFNIVDDELPTSKEFLKLYKKNVNRFSSIYVPYRIFYFLCFLWEIYSKWSKWQLPPVFNRRRCAIFWKGNNYSNKKIKRMLQWQPKVTINDGLKKYFKYQKEIIKKSA